MRYRFMLVLLLLAPIGVGAQGWDENFDGQTLDPRWTWRVPVEGPTFSLQERPGWLRVRIPQRQGGFNHWNQPVVVDEAPQLRTPAPAGDWELEARVQLQEFAPGSNFHAGIMIGVSDTQILTWGPFFGPGLPGGQQAVETWLEPTGTTGYARVRGESRDVTLRLTKTGFTISAALRRGEGDWIEGGTYTLLEPPRFIGLIGKTFFDGPGITFDVDYVRLIPREARPEPPLEATLRIDATAITVPPTPIRTGLSLQPVGPGVYGGLWAEMLNNRKFTGPAGPNGVVEGWMAVGAAPGITFAPDNRIHYAPVQSQRITRALAGAPCGIAQSGLTLRAGVGLVGRVVLRCEGGIGPVTVSLNAGERLLGEQKIPNVGQDWQTYPFTFPAPEAAVPDAEFRLTFEGAGTLWVGASSLMPADQVQGWRRDAVDLLKAIQPGVLCWPGGAMAATYRWEDGIGPNDRRPTRWDASRGVWESNDVGTHEFLSLCNLVGAQPYITVNIAEGDVRAATRWVAYCNAPPDTPMGRLRAENGHPEPFGVLYWSLEGEVPGRLPPLAHALKAAEFAQALRAADAKIRLAGVGMEDRGANEWNRCLLSVAGPDLDFLAVPYSHKVDAGADTLKTYVSLISGISAVERLLQRTAEAIARHAPAGKAIAVALNPWNLELVGARAPDGQAPTETLAAGLFACQVWNAFLRTGDRVALLTAGPSTGAPGALHLTPSAAVGTPVYLAFRLHNQRMGSTLVKSTVECPNLTLPGATDLPAVDAAATLSEDRRSLFVSVVNRHPLQTAQVTLALVGFNAAEGEWAALVGEGVAATNTPEKPDAVRVETRPLRAEELRAFSLPPHTAAVLTLRAR